jgi:hypothetical protein
MRNEVILGLAAVCIFGGGFVLGMLLEHRLFSIPGSQPNPPAPPALLSPADGAVLKGAKLAKALMWEFSWSKVFGAERYRIQIIAGPNVRPPPREFAKLTEIAHPCADVVVEEPPYRYTDLPPPSLLPMPWSEGDFRPKGWTWRVKAQAGGQWSPSSRKMFKESDDAFEKRVGGRWSEWSETRTFDVEIPAEWK